MTFEDYPCPHCKGVHRSSYNAWRCAARHDLVARLSDYETQQPVKQHRGTAKTNPTLTPEQAKAKGWKFWLRYCDSYGYTVSGSKV